MFKRTLRIFICAVLVFLISFCSVSCIPPPLPRPQSNYFMVMTMKDGMFEGLGSAFVVHSRPGLSLLATAHHVIADADLVGVVRNNSPVQAVVLVRDPVNDIAILLVLEGPWPSATLAIDVPSAGTRVVAVGPTPHNGIAITRGIISTGPGPCSSKDKGSSCIMADLGIGPGFSGGPVVDVFGRVVGLTTAYGIIRPHFAHLVLARCIDDLLKRALVIISRVGSDIH